MNEKTRAEELHDLIDPHLEDGDYAIIVAGDGSKYVHLSKPFIAAKIEGALTPENTFPLLLAAYGNAQVANAILDECMKGHWATCQPKEFQEAVLKTIEQAQQQNRTKIWTPDQGPVTS
jgi:hypothetical protein